MERKHNHKRNKQTREFKIGDRVSVSIPPIDRAHVTLPRLPCIVKNVSKVRESFYTLVCSHGVLNVKYRVSDLEPYNGVFNFDLDSAPSKEITLREAVRLGEMREKDLKETRTKCNCKVPCAQDNRCSCFKLKQKCTPHCHSNSKPPKNKCKNR